jgi:hypothetical protein
MKKSSSFGKNKKTLTGDIITQCFKLKKQKKGVKKYLQNQGFTLKEIAQIEKDMVGAHKMSAAPINGEHKFNPAQDKEWKSGLKFTKKYVYNKEDDKYVMYLKAANGNIVLPGDIVRGIVKNYSNWCGEEHSINELCRNYKIPRAYFNELKEVLGITHDSEPITQEELLEKDVHDIAEDLLQQKRFQLHQQFQKRSWEQTEEAASKWFKLQEGVYNPFVNFLTSWVPPKYSSVHYTGPKMSKTWTPRSLLVGLSDVHFGAKSNSKDSYRNKGYSTQEAVDCLENYTKKIKDIVEERNYGFESCVLASLGDILHTTGAGFTTKGTMLVHDCVKEEQFEAAFQSICKLIINLLSLFPKVHVKSVKGNHNDFGDYVLFKALECYFRTENRITFDVFQSDHGLFKINKCLFVISHGYSAEYKGRIPAQGKARESYIANLFLSKPETLQGVKQKVLLTADQHHLEMREYAEFEHYMLSTTVRGDKHSEAMGLNNMPRQSCFVIDSSGVKEIIYCYGRDSLNY